jgi:epoxyqueuosine reductase
MSELDIGQLTNDIKSWGADLGFQQLRITDIDLESYMPHFNSWLHENFHGEMGYMAQNVEMRNFPDRLVPGTIRVICARMDYASSEENSLAPLANTGKAYIARYARGRDYHKLIRKRLQQLAEKIESVAGPFGYRAFVDSAPVLERALAEKAGLGWIGKNTMLINKQAGSWFFLAELFTDLPLPIDATDEDHCGSCRACLDICPTQAFVEPNLLDATKCISYLTIESKTAIPLYLREKIGNRVFGCDDCQLVCPWNKFTHITTESGFSPRHSLDNADLVDLFGWSEQQFETNTQGSPIRRTGYDGWLRNLAVALGNAPKSQPIIAALEHRLPNASAMVQEHINWALEQQRRD